jgi:hypothetical protein
MKGITILVQNEKIGKQILFTETADINDLARYSDLPSKNCDLFFGFNKELYQDMFLPKERVFMNEIVDLVIEHQRFLSFPYYFPENEVMEKSRKNLVKME